MVSFSTKDSGQKAITGMNKTNKYIAKIYEYKANSEVFLIDDTN